MNEKAKSKSEAPTLPSQEVNIPEKLSEFCRYSEFKRLLDRIAPEGSGAHQKSIAVLSEYPGEGKTLFTSSLAVGFADLIRTKVLVVNTVTFDRKNSLTLERSLESDDIPVQGEPIKKTFNFNIDLLDIRTWRTTEEASQGGEEYHLASLIEKFKKDYGVILFDTCALATKNQKNIDPMVVAKRCDSAILVASQKSLKVPDRQLKMRFAQEKITLLGVVGNPGVSA